MSQIKLDSPFVSYELTEEESHQSKILGDLNKQMIQNLLFEATMEKVNLEWLPQNEAREKVLVGKIEILRFILDNHDIASTEAATQMRTSGHPTMMQEGVPIHQIFPRAPTQGIRLPTGEIVRPNEPDSN